MEVFNFLSSNSNLTTNVGIDGFITGLDKYKLVLLAKEYGIDLVKYDFFLKMYEELFLKRDRELRKEVDNG